jgi:hypothetical protein
MFVVMRDDFSPVFSWFEAFLGLGQNRDGRRKEQNHRHGQKFSHETLLKKLVNIHDLKNLSMG